MADCQNAETFVLIERVVGAEFGWVELLLVAAVSEVLEISATHFCRCRCGFVCIANLHYWDELFDCLEMECSQHYFEGKIKEQKRCPFLMNQGVICCLVHYPLLCFG